MDMMYTAMLLHCILLLHVSDLNSIKHCSEIYIFIYMYVLHEDNSRITTLYDSIATYATIYFTLFVFIC